MSFTENHCCFFFQNVYFLEQKFEIIALIWEAVGRGGDIKPQLNLFPLADGFIKKERRVSVAYEGSHATTAIL